MDVRGDAASVVRADLFKFNAVGLLFRVIELSLKHFLLFTWLTSGVCQKKLHHLLRCQARMTDKSVTAKSQFTIVCKAVQFNLSNNIAVCLNKRPQAVCFESAIFVSHPTLVVIPISSFYRRFLTHL